MCAIFARGPVLMVMWMLPVDHVTDIERVLY